MAAPPDEDEKDANQAPLRSRTVTSSAEPGVPYRPFVASPGAFTGSESYEILTRLGQGGMGEVYKAFDPKLGRFAALKVLRNATPEHAARLMKEARAQARVEHANVCKVYGVGELDGEPFIALQYVEDGTLASAAPSMSRDQLIELMRDVAEALHAAHRQGLVHRDVKPTNILVEKIDGGGYRPFVADFGIARELESPSATASGAAVGTPMYMAPEQARGELHRIDARTDVYAVGATLYEVLSQRRPFSGTNGVDVMNQVVNDDPPSLRSIDSTIPTDLETIVLKAMEKEPARRYESARALADDLQRYLDGDPIESRRGRFVYRMVKRARKHRVLLVAPAVALLVAAVVGGIALRARRTAAERARLVHAFGKEVERIDASARYAVLLPLHDTAEELTTIRERMAAIRAEMAARGAIADGPGHDALGRAHLALGEHEAAVRELDAAFAAGERTPEVAYALGRAHGALYQQGIAALMKADDAGVDEERRKELERRHRDPALRALESVGGPAGAGWSSFGPGAREYAAGLIALYHERYDEALAKAREATSRVRWLHEAHTLEGDIHLLAAKERSWRRDLDGARRELALAGDAYRAATQVAPSSSAAWLGECQRLSTDVTLDADRSLPIASKVESAAAACGKAHSTRPDDPEPLATGAWVWQLMVLAEGKQSATATHAFGEAVRLGEAALKLDANHLHALLAMGLANEWRALQELRGGGDPRSSLERGKELARRALGSNPRDYDALVLMSQLWTFAGDFESDHEIDVRRSTEQAVAYGRKALAVAPNGSSALDALGHALMLQEYWELNYGGDPTGSYHQLTALYEQIVRTSATFGAAFNNKCCMEYGFGEFQRRRGVDPTATLEQAIASCQRSIDAEANSPFPMQGQAEAYVALAQWKLERKIDATPTVDKALAVLRRALALDADNAYARHVVGDLELLRARLEMQAGADPKVHLAAAETEYRRAVALNPREVNALTGLGELFLRRAEWQTTHSGSARSELAQGLDFVAQAQKTSPQLGLPAAIEGALHLTAARAASGEARRREARTAGTAIGRALRLNVNLEREYRPLLSEAGQLAIGAPSASGR